MNLGDFDYNLPKELIAQTPANPRDHSRLLVLTHTDADNLPTCRQARDSHGSTHEEKSHCEPLSPLKARQSIEKIAEPVPSNRGIQTSRNDVKLEHRHFYDIIDYLNPGDVLVMNDSKVFPARLIGQKEITHGGVEILLNHEIEPGLWQCVGKNLKVDNRIKFDNSKLSAIVIMKRDDIYQIRFNMTGGRLFKEIEKIGLVPLPPYIKRKLKTKNYQLTTSSDRSSYQTVYAKEIGSVAAPTAGLHFTKRLINQIKKKGINIEYVTLHVGLGTFAAVKSEIIEKHKIHKEYYSIDQKSLMNIVKAKSENRRIIAVGTTTVRTLEHIYKELYAHRSLPQINADIFRKAENLTSYKLQPNSYLSDWTDIFIYPGYEFKCVDGLITNFHLPKSTLLMLVSAFAGKSNIDCAYKEAIVKKYRFYSYGDAMLII